MTLYLAAPFEAQAAMVLLALDLTQEGFTIRAEWLTHAADDVRPEDALQDLADIEAADAVVVYNPRDFWRAGSGGRHVELGYALALRKPVVLWGRASNVFHTLPEVIAVEDRDDVIPALQQIAERLDSRILF